jgi:Pvc16 N-terminal domain
MADYYSIAMIVDALKLILAQLNAAIPSADGVPVVALGNIARSEQGEGGGQSDLSKVVLSLVNLEEERTLKNGRPYVQIGDRTEQRPLPVNLNLYLLFTSNYDNYETALSRLGEVIGVFQRQSVYTQTITKDGVVNDLRLILELNTLSFEQINYLWGSLGGKQAPFVLYKCRLVSIQSAQPQGSGVIEEMTSQENLN